MPAHAISVVRLVATAVAAAAAAVVRARSTIDSVSRLELHQVSMSASAPTAIYSAL